jgi:ABC-type glycerol-3-phosphate transport system substrate-binding protein
MVGALIMLKLHKPEVDPSEAPFGAVTIWGTLPSEPMQTVLDEMKDKDKNYINVRYVYVDPTDLSNRLVQALADRKPPDLILASQEEFQGIRKRLQTFSYQSSMPLATFRSTYVDGAEVFTSSSGFFGYPIAVDPLLLFWNRDIVTSGGFFTSPQTWEELVNDYIPTLTKFDARQNITTPTIALGGNSNINNFMPVFSMLLLQGGSQMIRLDDRGGYQILLDKSTDGTKRPFLSAATFYSNFSSKTNTLYTWDPALPLDKTMFLGNDLALYFGFGSEIRDTLTRNPNLNFDVSVSPQGSDAVVKRTYGKFYTLFLTADSENKSGAAKVLGDLSSSANSKKIADRYYLAPARRSLLVASGKDPYQGVLYSSALIARGWYNPNTKQTGSILSQMVDEINNDRSSVATAVRDALNRLEQSY